MAKCLQCGKDVGWGSVLCRDCKKKGDAATQVQREPDASPDDVVDLIKVRKEWLRAKEEQEKEAVRAREKQERMAAAAGAEVSAEKSARARAVVTEGWREEIEAAKAPIVARLKAGERVFLYQKLYLPVDSHINDETIGGRFSIESLRALGPEGWEVVATVPRTLGLRLENYSVGLSTGRTWGGGLGGNVVGVYLILRKELTVRGAEGDQESLDWDVYQHIVRQES